MVKAMSSAKQLDSPFNTIAQNQIGNVLWIRRFAAKKYFKLLLPVQPRLPTRDRCCKKTPRS